MITEKVFSGLGARCAPGATMSGEPHGPARDHPCVSDDRRPSIAWATLLAVGWSVLSGCSPADRPRPAPSGATSKPAATPATVGSGPAVSCAHDIGGTPPDADAYELVLDAVALPAGTLDPQQSGEPGWLFAKQGLVVRAGIAVEITIAPPAGTRARIGWGSPGPEGTTLQVPACPSGSGWLAFAGGYTVRDPMCVPLIIRTSGQQQRADVRVGAGC